VGLNRLEMFYHQMLAALSPGRLRTTGLPESKNPTASVVGAVNYNCSLRNTAWL
jgi:hypothetical protein